MHKKSTINLMFRPVDHGQSHIFKKNLIVAAAYLKFLKNINILKNGLWFNIVFWWTSDIAVLFRVGSRLFDEVLWRNSLIGKKLKKKIVLTKTLIVDLRRLLLSDTLRTDYSSWDISASHWDRRLIILPFILYNNSIFWDLLVFGS